MTKEIGKLINLLFDHCIPFEVTDDACGNRYNQVWYPSKEESVCDAICHEYSYGYEMGLLEMMGLLTENESKVDSVVGWLTAEQVFERIWRHWFDNHKQVLITMTSEDDGY